LSASNDQVQHPLDALQGFLQARRKDSPTVNSLVVALSGGPDSLALLLAAAQIAPQLGYALRALHVHHGLHADADRWAEQAVQQAAAVNVCCQILRVRVAQQASVEGAARQARYDALAQAMAPHEALLLAHHQDDQAETLLLRLMRGAGLQGLSGMAAVSAWSSGAGVEIARWRPWLALPRQTIARWLPRAVACCHSHAPHLPLTALQPVQDPANQDARFDRTLLRGQVLPLLTSRWPEAAALLARSAAQVAQQAQALNSLADIWLAGQPHVRTLSVAALSSLDNASIQAVLSRWLSLQKASPLPVAYWSRVTIELLEARQDANPVLHWSNLSLRRFQGQIFLVRDAELRALPEGIPWDNPQQALHWAGKTWLPLGLAPDHPLWQKPWRISPRQGGERWRPAGRAHHVLLKHWCQDQAIPPWQRQAIACIWAGETVVCIVTPEPQMWLAHEVMQQDLL
jgi:tRNA(Ile)-lysidine synthase